MSANNPQTHSADDDLYLTSIEEGNMPPANVGVKEPTLLNILVHFMVVLWTCVLLTKGAYLSRAARSV